MTEQMDLTKVEESNIVAKEVFGMTVEQAQKSIDTSLALYKLAGEVIQKLLVEEKDMYYMSELSYGGKRKDGEVPVINKQGVDKLLGFFKLKTYPNEEKIDGGYKVTVTGEDMNGNYIATATGVCTKYEKKYAWIRADDEEYAAADECDRRTVRKKGQYGKTYESKQIRTDERAIAHTLISMATKRARAAFLRMALPGLSDISFEGEEPQVNYDSEESTNTMSKKDITTWYKRVTGKYGVPAVEALCKEILGTVKVSGMSVDSALVIEERLKEDHPDE